eukprot:scaffold345687_cov42-Prasinocladus_malaysianus.AAC.1
MDSFAALALATESPTRSLLDQKPNGREEPLISGRMWIHIIGQAGYQIFIGLFFMFAIPLLPGYTYPDDCRRTCAQWNAGVQAPCLQLVKPDAVNICPPGVLDCPELQACMNTFNEQATVYEEAVHAVDMKINSFFFNAFIWLQLANLLNARKINDEWNIFEGVLSSSVFLSMYALILVLQIIIMEVPFMNTIFGIQAITPEQWGLCIAIGFSCIII